MASDRRAHPLGRTPTTKKALGVAVASFCLGLPFLRYVAWLGDEGMWLHTATRLLRGEGLRLPAEFLSLSPGASVVVAGWMALFGESLLACRILALLTLAAIAAFTYAACLRASRSGWLAAGCAVGWAVLAQGGSPVVSHHWFGAALASGAVWAALAALEGCPRRRLVTAGLLSGGAMAFVPHVGAVAAVTSLVAARGARRAVLTTALAIGVVPIATLVVLLSTGQLSLGALPAAVTSARTFAATQGLPFAFGVDARSWPLAALFPATLALLVAAVGVRRARGWRDPRCAVLVTAAIGGFVACFPRADTVHICFAAPMALPLLAWSLGQLRTAWQARERQLASRLLAPGGAAVALALMAPTVWTTATLAWRVGTIPLVELARGSVAFGDGTDRGDLTRLLGRLGAIPRTDRFFFYPYVPMLPYLLDRSHVAPVDMLHPGLTSPAQYAASARAVAEHAQWIVVDRVWMAPETLKGAFPALAEPNPPEKSALEESMWRGFELDEAFGRYQLWHRKSAPRDARVAPQ